MLLLGLAAHAPPLALAQDEGEEEPFDDEGDFGSEEEEAVEEPNPAEPEFEYIGKSECTSCHRDLGSSHSDTRHAQTLRQVEDDTSAILADFGQGADIRTVQFPNEDSPRPFTPDDVAFVLGSGRHVQRYVFQAGEDQYYVYPAEWNAETGAWQPYKLAENWIDPAYDFVQNCAGCHTTALRPESAKWEDDGVQCEACHGPGGSHADAADDAGSRPTEEERIEIRASIVNSPDAQICGQCHSRGSSASYPYPSGYMPGANLLAEGVYTLVAADDPTHWWSTGHAMQPNMQFNEWLASGHATALTTLKGDPNAEDGCLECHSGDYRYAQTLLADAESEDANPTPITLETAQFGVTCTVCHAPHQDAPTDFMLVKEPAALCEDCHRDTELTASAHHPSTEIYEGQKLVENVEGKPSSHFTEGALCTTCHMPSVPTGAEQRFSHSLDPTLPTTEANAPPSVCTTCHTDLSTDYMQKFVAETQAKITTRLNTIDAAQETRLSLPGWVLVITEAVGGDGSYGLHNYAYTDALLDAAELELGLVQINHAELAAANGKLADPATCEECHRDEFRQWQASPHANASLSSAFLQEYAAQGRPTYCMDCHASGYNPDTGTYSFEGVVCSMCHANVSETDHPPAPVEILTDSQTCGQCHSGAHAPTYDEWLVSDHNRAGIDCVDCHTPHNNGLLLGDVNTTCGDCHQEALVDEVHMAEDMTCTECHLTRRTTQGGVHVVSTGHTMSIDPGVCAECHGNTHLLSVRETNRPAEETDELQRLRAEINDLQAEADRNLNSGLVGGALGVLLLIVMVYLIIRLRRLL